MAGLNYFDRDARWAKRYQDRRYNQRHYISPSATKHEVTNVAVPEDVVRLEVHAPCFNCGARDGCKHRPWLLNA